MNEEKNVGGSVPLYLNKINSDKKAIECANIIEAGHPVHSERLWVVGFLKFCGYSMTEVLDIIREHSEWADYNERITAYQIGTVFHQRPQRTQNHQTRQVRKWALSELEILRIKYQRSVALSKQLCEEHPMEFAHPERLASSDFNPSTEFLRK